MTLMTLCTVFKPKTHDETFHDLETKVLVCKEAPLKEGPYTFPSSVIHDTLKEATFWEGRLTVGQS